MRTMLRHVRRWAFAALVGAATLAGVAQAQQPVPPETYTVDPRGVDLVTGAFIYPANDVVIGQPGAGGLAHGRIYLAGGAPRDSQLGTITISGSTYIVSVGGESEVFTKSGSVFTPQSQRGATLSQAGLVYTFTSASGASAQFFSYYTNVTTPYGANAILLGQYIQPNGEHTSYNYNGVTYCRLPNPEGGCEEEGAAARLQSVTNNRGYMLHYDYESDIPDQIVPWLALQKVTGINLASEYCGPIADDCTLTGTWPSVTYGSSGSNETATDQSGRVTTYTAGSYGLTAIRLPGSGSDDVTLTTNALLQTTALTNASGAWTYSYTDVGTTRTTVANGPLGQSMTVVSDLTIGRATSVTQRTATPATTRTWNYAYDGQRRLQRITNPEGVAAGSGDYVEYQYDARGNLNMTTAVPKTGSVLSNIVTYTDYPPSCPAAGITVANCNRPLATRDGRGAQTDYVWSSVHGGLESVTEPFPSLPGATRPQTRTSYAAQTAYYRNSPSTFTAGSAITLPTATSACASGSALSGCLGTAVESRTTIAYPSSGTPNNLLPANITSGDGSGTLAARTAFTYDRNGDVVTIDGPLGSGGAGVDVATLRYDTARRLTGVIGPDPDGGGALLNRAQRMTLNDRNQPELVELGTTSGVNWPSFTTLQRQSAVYGTYGRTLRVANETAAAAPLTLTQFNYDAAGRIDCTAVRMNPSLWGSLPGSACTAQTPGDFGPDRISQNGYDAAGRVISSTSGVGSTPLITESVTYTANGQPATLTDGRASISAIEYDGFDRPARMRYPDPSTGAPSTTDDELFAYDANANLVTFTNRSSQVLTTTFDALNRATATSASGSTTPPNPALTPPVTMAYDLLNRPLTASVTSGVATTFTWDALGRQLTEVGPTGTMTYAYDIAGRRTGQTWPDGFAIGYDWNMVGEMTFINRLGGAIVAYAYDDLGRRSSITRPNGIGTTYAYDDISRLTGLNHLGTANVALTFTYNPAGQIVTRAISNPIYAYAAPTGTTNYLLDRLNRIDSANTVDFDYDDNSNLIDDGVRTYSYDNANRLIGGGSPTGALSYDALGRLDILTGTYGGRYVYTGVEAVALANPSTNVIENHFVRGPGVDEIVANYPTATMSNPLFWLLDERNSLMALTDVGGATPYTNGYDEYGNPRPGNLGRFQYTGQLLMPDFGAYHYKARAYGASMGRFLQADPIGYAAGANLYAYVRADPLNFVDPRGLQGCQTPDHWIVTRYANSGPTWKEGQEISRELVWREVSCGDVDGVWNGGGFGSPLTQEQKCGLRFWGSAFSEVGQTTARYGGMIASAGLFASYIPGGQAAGGAMTTLGVGSMAFGAGSQTFGAFLTYWGGDPRAAMGETLSFMITFDDRSVFGPSLRPFEELAASEMAGYFANQLPKPEGCEQSPSL